MRFLYSFLIVLSTPFVLLYFVLRGLRDRAYLSRWNERFGFIPVQAQPGSIWVHAASVGEFNAASPLIRALLKTYPDIPLTVTTLTPTGSERVKRDLGDKVMHSYVPIDLPGAVNRFLHRLQPRLIIVMETEIWPNLYLQVTPIEHTAVDRKCKAIQTFSRTLWVSTRFRRGCYADRCLVRSAKQRGC